MASTFQIERSLLVKALKRDSNYLDNYPSYAQKYRNTLAIIRRYISLGMTTTNYSTLITSYRLIATQPDLVYLAVKRGSHDSTEL